MNIVRSLSSNKVESFTPANNKPGTGLENIASNRGLRSDLQRLHDVIMILDERLSQLKVILEPVRLFRPAVSNVKNTDEQPTRAMLSEWVQAETDHVNVLIHDVETLITEVEI